MKTKTNDLTYLMSNRIAKIFEKKTRGGYSTDAQYVDVPFTFVMIFANICSDAPAIIVHNWFAFAFAIGVAIN